MASVMGREGVQVVFALRLFAADDLPPLGLAWKLHFTLLTTTAMCRSSLTLDGGLGFGVHLKIVSA